MALGGHWPVYNRKYHKRVNKRETSKVFLASKGMTKFMNSVTQELQFYLQGLIPMIGKTQGELYRGLYNFPDKMKRMCK